MSTPGSTPLSMGKTDPPGSSGAPGGAGGAGAGAASDAEPKPLPHLPVPELEESAALFAKTIAPLLSHSERKELDEQLEELLAEGGNGRKLQALLKSRAASTDNWLEEYWYNSYLKGRDPLPGVVSPFFVLEDDPTPSRSSQSARATSLIVSTLKFFMVWKAGQLTPDVFKHVPLDMSQYNCLFSSTRLPGAREDMPMSFDDSRHIVILCCGQFYWFNVLTPDGKLCLPADRIADNLRAIRTDATASPPRQNAQQAVGVLTAERRDTWHRARARLASMGEANKESLRLIDSAIFVVCLDETSPNTLSSQCANYLTGTTEVDDGVQVGTCINRWFDKTLQLVVCRNGSAGILFEHSMVDGHTVLRLASDVFTDTILRFAQSINRKLPSFMEALGTAPSSTDANPNKIHWQLTPDLHHSIRKAEAQYSDLITRTETLGMEFANFGKSFIVSNNLSPDALVQVAFQIAYYHLYGELKNTYETVMTKHFLHGRTEVARPVTAAVHTLVHQFYAAASADVKVTSLRTAVQEQVDFVRRCTKGMGSERHFFGLKCLAQEHGIELPKLFSSKAMRIINHSTISTSNCGNPSLRLFGFAPVVDDGFGIGYIIKDDGIQFCVSSHRRQTQRFVDTLSQVLRDIASLLGSDMALSAKTMVPAGSLPLRTPRTARAGSVVGLSNASRGRGASVQHAAPPSVPNGGGGHELYHGHGHASSSKFGSHVR